MTNLIPTGHGPNLPGPDRSPRGGGRLPAGSMVLGGAGVTLRPLTAGDAAFVGNLPTAGAITGADRTRLTLIRDSAQGTSQVLFNQAVARLAQ